MASQVTFQDIVLAQMRNLDSGHIVRDLLLLRAHSNTQGSITIHMKTCSRMEDRAKPSTLVSAARQDEYRRSGSGLAARQPAASTWAPCHASEFRSDDRELTWNFGKGSGTGRDVIQRPTLHKRHLELPPSDNCPPGREEAVGGYRWIQLTLKENDLTAGPRVQSMHTATMV